MGKFIFLFSILMICAAGVIAQTKIRPGAGALPVNIGKMRGAHSDALLNDAAIKMRLQRLLGEESYRAFLESFETHSPIVRKGKFLFTSGCLIHACTHLESAVAVDLARKTVHAAIYRQGEKTAYFNENRRKTPKVIRNWANRLSEINSESRLESPQR